MNEPGYVAQKRRLDHDVAEPQSAKRAKLREGKTICPYGGTCNNARSHFAADGVRSGQLLKVRNVALQNLLANAIYLCPFAIPEGVSCLWSGIPFEIESHVRDSHDGEKFKVTGESEWIGLSLSVVQTYQILDKLFSKFCSRNTHGYISQFFTSDIRTILVATHIILKIKNVNSEACISESGAMLHNCLKDRD